MENLNGFKNNIIPIWQPQGYSTHIIAKKVSELLGTKTAHTGTLDPMAEGVIIILSGENRNNKYDYAKWVKGYEFEIALGIQTDSLDGLGQIVATSLENNENIQEEKLRKILKDFEGAYSQRVPDFSAIKVKGKPMHWWTRNNMLEEIQIPRRNGTIYKIKLIETNQKNITDIANNTIKRVENVSGNLRQDQAVHGWKDIIKQYSKSELLVIKIYVEVSKGLYIRQLSQDILKKLGQIGFTNSIIRIKNGEFTKDNSMELEKIFSKEKLQSKEFKSHFNY